MPQPSLESSACQHACTVVAMDPPRTRGDPVRAREPECGTDGELRLSQQPRLTVTCHTASRQARLARFASGSRERAHPARHHDTASAGAGLARAASRRACRPESGDDATLALRGAAGAEDGAKTDHGHIMDRNSNAMHCTRHPALLPGLLLLRCRGRRRSDLPFPGTAGHSDEHSSGAGTRGSGIEENATTGAGEREEQRGRERRGDQSTERVAEHLT